MLSQQCGVSSQPPKGWPADCGAAHMDRNEWAVPVARRPALPGVAPRKIDAADHPCRGGYGLFATRVWRPFEILGERGSASRLFFLVRDSRPF